MRLALAALALLAALHPGQTAPDFTLSTADGRSEVTLSKLYPTKPVVLIFGNFTCGPFRSQAGNVEKLFERYRDRATFVMVYVREAHPTDGCCPTGAPRSSIATACAIRSTEGRSSTASPVRRSWCSTSRDASAG